MNIVDTLTALCEKHDLTSISFSVGTIGYRAHAYVHWAQNHACADGLIECKSRDGKYQVQTIANDEVPEEYVLQLQTALLVSERDWIDFISYSGGQPVYVKRVFADPELQAAIIAAATAFEARVADVIREYHATLARMPKLIPTERREIEEIII